MEAYRSVRCSHMLPAPQSACVQSSTGLATHSTQSGQRRCALAPVRGHRRNDRRWAFARVTLLRLPVWSCVLSSRPALFVMLVVPKAGMMYVMPNFTLELRKVRTGALCTCCTDPWRGHAACCFASTLQQLAQTPAGAAFVQCEHMLSMLCCAQSDRTEQRHSARLAVC